jgi:hypothetical protein
MSANEGARFWRYQGAVRRWRSVSAVGSPLSAYQMSVRVWQRKPNGTVRSTARSTRLRAWPTPSWRLACWKATSIAQRSAY